MSMLAPTILLIGVILYFVSNMPPKVTKLGEICIWRGLGFSLYFFGAK